MNLKIENPFVICANILNTAPEYYAISNIMEMARFLINDLQQEKFDINQRTLKLDSTPDISEQDFFYRSSSLPNENKTLLMAFLNNAPKITKKDFSFIHLLIKSGADLSLDEKKYKVKHNEEVEIHTWAQVFQINTELDEFLAQTYYDEFGATAFSDFLAKHNMLHDATERNNQSFVKFCVEHLGVDINLKNKLGETPAMKILRGGTCNFFMNYPVDWNAKDHQGKSVLVHFGAKNGDEGQKLYKRLYHSLSKGDTQPMEMKESVGDSVIKAISNGHNMESLKSMLKNYKGKPEEINDQEGNNLLQVALKHGRWAFYKHLKNNFSFDQNHTNLFGQNAIHTFFRYGSQKDNGDPYGKRRKETMENIIGHTSFSENLEYNMRDCMMETIQSKGNFDSGFLAQKEKNQLFPQWVNLAAQQVKESERKDFFRVATECFTGITKENASPLNKIFNFREEKYRATIAVMRLFSWNKEQDNSKTLDLILTTLFEPPQSKTNVMIVNIKSAEAMLFGVLSIPTPSPQWWTEDKKNHYLNNIITVTKNTHTLEGGFTLLPLIALLLIDNKKVSTDNFNYINQWAQKTINKEIDHVWQGEKWKEIANYWKQSVLSSHLHRVAGENIAVIKKNKI